MLSYIPILGVYTKKPTSPSKNINRNIQQNQIHLHLGIYLGWLIGAHARVCDFGANKYEILIFQGLCRGSEGPYVYVLPNFFFSLAK